MARETAAKTPPRPWGRSGGPEHFDVLILGAGISGIGAAYHLLDQRPGTTFALLDALDSSAGPGGPTSTRACAPTATCSPSATGSRPGVATPSPPAARSSPTWARSIEENDLARHIRYRHRVEPASWSSEDSRWTVTATNLDTDEPVVITGGFLWMCHGYYRHGQAHKPEWEGLEDFEGDGPAPPGVARGGRPQGQADRGDRLGCDRRHPHPGDRRRGRARHHAAAVAHLLPGPQNTQRAGQHAAGARHPARVDPRDRAPADLQDDRADAPGVGLEPRASQDADDRRGRGPGCPRTSTSTPTSPPPTGCGSSGSPSCRAATCSRRSARARSRSSPTPSGGSPRPGIKTGSGEHLEADVIVTATGFELSVLGDVASASTAAIDPADLVTYRGIMFTGLPNLAYVFGYFRASWTLRADIISDFVCRLLAHMEEKGRAQGGPDAARRRARHGAASLGGTGQLQPRVSHAARCTSCPSRAPTTRGPGGSSTPRRRRRWKAPISRTGTSRSRSGR